MLLFQELLSQFSHVYAAQSRQAVSVFVWMVTGHVFKPRSHH